MLVVRVRRSPQLIHFNIHYIQDPIQHDSSSSSSSSSSKVFKGMPTIIVIIIVITAIIVVVVIFTAPVRTARTTLVRVMEVVEGLGSMEIGRAEEEEKEEE